MDLPLIARPARDRTNSFNYLELKIGRPSQFSQLINIEWPPLHDTAATATTTTAATPTATTTANTTTTTDAAGHSPVGRRSGAPSIGQ